MKKRIKNKKLKQMAINVYAGLAMTTPIRLLNLKPSFKKLVEKELKLRLKKIKTELNKPKGWNQLIKKAPQ